MLKTDELVSLHAEVDRMNNAQVVLRATLLTTKQDLTDQVWCNVNGVCCSTASMCNVDLTMYLPRPFLQEHQAQEQISKIQIHLGRIYQSVMSQPAPKPCEIASMLATLECKVKQLLESLQAQELEMRRMKVRQ